MGHSKGSEAQPVWIRGPRLRKRWDDMPNSTFYERLKRGVIPAPEYPFGPTTPYWRLEVIEAYERRATEGSGTREVTA